MYSYFSSSMLPHHHVRINEELKNDLLVWNKFLCSPTIYCRPFIDFNIMLFATDLEWATDASGKIGVGGVHNNQWFWDTWTTDFLEQKPSIEFQELYGVAVSIFLWAKLYENKRICLFCDNQAVVHMINNSSSSCKCYMVLIRLITLKSLELNMRIFAKFIPTFDNYFADALSRAQLSHFWALANKHGRKFEEFPLNIPEELKPIMGKIWKT